MIAAAAPYTVRVACAMHCVGALGAVLALALAPPASGAMLLVPLVGDAPVVRLAMDHGGLLLGAEGDRIVVRGERRAMWWPLLRHGVLAIAAPRGGCGESA